MQGLGLPAIAMRSSLSSAKLTLVIQSCAYSDKDLVYINKEWGSYELMNETLNDIVLL